MTPKDRKDLLGEVLDGESWTSIIDFAQERLTLDRIRMEQCLRVARTPSDGHAADAIRAQARIEGMVLFLTDLYKYSGVEMPSWVELALTSPHKAR